MVITGRAHCFRDCIYIYAVDAELAERNLTNFGNLLELLWHRVQARNQDFFVAGEVSWNRKSSIKVSCMTYNRKTPQEKNLCFLSKILLEPHFK